MKIIQIDGIRGLFTALFTGVCLFAGFVIFPGYCAQHLWNTYFVTLLEFPAVNLFQGVLLWAMTLIVYCILFKSDFAISMKNTPELSDDELNSIIRKARAGARMKMMNNIMTKADKFELRRNDIIKTGPSDKDTAIMIAQPEAGEKKDDDNVSTNVKQ